MTTVSPPGLIIAAPASGSGKTTVTLGILAALRADGLKVQAFKLGPDYIDPGFHRAASGRPSYNLDSWAMPVADIAGLIGTAEPADLILAEGAMGLFDGVARAGASGKGSAADIAAMTGWPVVLVIDVSGQAQTAAATALGCATLRPGLAIVGVILNRVASARHEALVRDGMQEAGIRVFGALPRRSDLSLPERHLGLVQAEEQTDIAARIAAIAGFARENLDLDGLRSCARASILQGALPRQRPPGQRIALARDAAFSFAYPHLTDGWRAAGAEILPFSPLADQPPSPEADVVWLPGGYPELHAGVLAAAQTFRHGLALHAATRPVHGECGGYMALGAGLVDATGTRHQMAGLLGLETSFAQRRMHLGYRRAVLEQPMPGHAAGAILRGHEFHYATILAQPDLPLARVTDASDTVVAETGSRRGLVTGSFFHLIAEDRG